MKKINFKKILATLLVPTLILSLSTSAFASPSAAVTANPTPSFSVKSVTSPVPQYLQAEAIVKAIYSEGRLLVSIDGMEVALNTDEKTLVVDAKSGLPGQLSTLKVGAKVFVYYSPAMTKSLPPQSYATAIAINLQEGKARPALFIVKEVVSQSKNEIRVLNTAGDLIVTITKDIPVTPFKTKQIVKFSDISVGSKIFVWYEIVALSYPGQTGAQKVVYIGQAPENKLVINDKTIDLKNQANGSMGLIEENGQILVPLRLVSKSLGFKLHWDSKNRTIAMDNGEVKTILTLGSDSYYKASSKAIGLTQSIPLGAAPRIVGNQQGNGSVYVPASLFNLLYSNDEAVTILAGE